METTISKLNSFNPKTEMQESTLECPSRWIPEIENSRYSLLWTDRQRPPSLNGTKISLEQRNPPKEQIKDDVKDELLKQNELLKQEIQSLHDESK